MYHYKTTVGIFRIVERAGRWHIVYKEENLGTYAKARQAADDLAAGHTFFAASGVELLIHSLCGA